MDKVSARSSVLSLDLYLNPAYRGPGAQRAIAGALAAGKLVVLNDAVQAPFAERMHRCLNTATGWRVYEGGGEGEYSNANFRYHHHNLYPSDPTAFPADLTWCKKVFGSDATRLFAARLSGRDCNGPLHFGASWYLPGDHSLPHTDSFLANNESRKVAFVWHLTREWDRTWGGALYWCRRGLYLPPSFNTLVLFNVGPESDHFVTTVSPYAQGKRLAINGWWTGPAGQVARPTPDQPTPLDIRGATALAY